MNNAFGVFVFIACLLGQYKAEAFGCYKCNSNEHELCLSEPDQLSTSSYLEECDGYCTILRTEYTDIPGKIITLVRDCEKEPKVLNGVRTDKHYTKMYTSCNSDKCNSGDGNREPGEDNNGATGPKDVITVYESGSNWNKPLHLFTLATIIWICFLQ